MKLNRNSSRPAYSLDTYMYIVYIFYTRKYIVYISLYPTDYMYLKFKEFLFGAVESSAKFAFKPFYSPTLRLRIYIKIGHIIVPFQLTFVNHTMYTRWISSDQTYL